MTPHECAPASRRDFLKVSTTAILGGALAGELPIAQNAHAAGSDLLRVGLVGCGGRGTGAAAQALRTAGPVQLVAMADAFADRVEGAHKNLLKDNVADRVNVDASKRFIGVDGFENGHLADVEHRLARPAARGHVHDRALEDPVEVPLVVGDVLVVPGQLARLRADRHRAVGVERVRVDVRRDRSVRSRHVVV